VNLPLRINYFRRPDGGVSTEEATLDGLDSLPELLCRIASSSSGIAQLDLPARRCFLVSDPALVREVLATKAVRYRKGHDAIRKVLGNGLFTSDDPDHASQLRHLWPHFNHASISALLPAMVTSVNTALTFALSGSPIDIGRAMRRVTLAVGAQLFFDYPLDDQDDEVGTAILEVTKRAAASILGHITQRQPREELRRFHAARAKLNALADDVMMQQEARFAAFGLQDTTTLAGTIRLGVWSTGARRDQLLTLLLAAQESSAVALTWVFYLLARHQDIQNRLADELETICKSAPNGAPPTFVSHVLMEAMRLFPPAWLLGRRPRDSIMIRSVCVTPNDAIFISPYAMHRDERVYPNAREFIPTRWEAQPATPTFIPFGIGPRGCIGERFALQELVTIISAVIRRFRLTLADDAPVQLQPLITLRPARPVMLHLSSR